MLVEYKKKEGKKVFTEANRMELEGDSFFLIWTEGTEIFFEKFLKENLEYLRVGSEWVKRR